MDIFDGIENTACSSLLKNIRVLHHSFASGEMIISEGSKCVRLYRLKKGKVIAKQSFLDGHDNIVKILEEGAYIGINLLFSSIPVYKASFYAVGEVELASISQSDLINIMSNSSVVMKNVLSLISNFACSLNDHIRLLSHKKIKAKLAYFLLSESNKRKSDEFMIPYSKTELAAFLNVERPSLSKELSQLIELKMIENQGKNYKILDFSKLRGLIDE